MLASISVYACLTSESAFVTSDSATLEFFNNIGIRPTTTVTSAGRSRSQTIIAFLMKNQVLVIFKILLFSSFNIFSAPPIKFKLDPFILICFYFY